MAFRATKRQRLTHPQSWMDCESMEVVPTTPIKDQQYIRTTMASALVHEIFFDRLDKEIVQAFRFSLSTQIRLCDTDASIHEAKSRRALILTRLIAGINSCTRVLEAAIRGQGPSPLVLVVASDIPPTLVSHLPILAEQSQTPILLLPGSSTSSELGRLLGTKYVGVMAIASRTVDHTTLSEREEHIHASIDSFARFIASKIA